MKIISLGYNFQHDKNFTVSRREGLDEGLILIVRSRAVFRINEKRYSVLPNSLIFIDERTPHSFSADNECFVNDWVAVKFEKKEREMLIENKIRPNFFFRSSEATFCSEIIRLMQSEAVSAKGYKEDNLVSFLHIFLRKFYELSDCFTERKRYYSELKRLREEIYKTPHRQRTLRELACDAGLSYSYFQFLYKSYFGVPPMTDVILACTEYAKNLLLYTDYSVREIAETLGYWSDAQFIKQFKSIVGKTPFQYRKRS